MISSFEELVANINASRSQRRDTRPLTKRQLTMIRQQYNARVRGVFHFAIVEDSPYSTREDVPSR